MSTFRKLLVLAPYCDGQDVGEAWCAYQWVSHLAKHADVTLLTLRRSGRTPASEQLPDVETVEWDESTTFRSFERFSSMFKPSYLGFYTQAKRWIAKALSDGRRFDIAHQFTPIALRYPSPLSGFEIPYVLGPLGGSLDTPAAFLGECQSSPWYTKFRSIDKWRLRRDPMLLRSLGRAQAVLGVAPYVGELIEHASPQRFEVISELGIDGLAPPAGSRSSDCMSKKLRLVHVGRAVRTKGLRDAIRAISRLPSDVDVVLDVAGQGEEFEICKAEALAAGVEDLVIFHGQISRESVEALYAQADAFLFPSFREPSGSVVFEAMRHGLPVIAADRGGPGFVVDESCGVLVPVRDPEQLASDLCDAIVRLARDRSFLDRLSIGAKKRVESIGLWENKVRWLQDFYTDLLTSSNANDLREAS